MAVSCHPSCGGMWRRVCDAWAPCNRCGFRGNGRSAVRGRLGCLEVPSDVQISVGAAFVSHLESFWREVIILTASATVVAFCCSRYAKRRLTGTN